MEQIPRVLPWAFVFWPFRPYITQKRDLSSRRDIETSAQGNALGCNVAEMRPERAKDSENEKCGNLATTTLKKMNKQTYIRVTVLPCYCVTVSPCHRVTVSLCYLQTLDKFSYSNGFKPCKLWPIFLQKLFLSSALVMVCQKSDTVTR